MDASGRRQYSVEFKRRLAKLALEPGASVAGIALAHQINANHLFKWRQEYLQQGGQTATDAAEPERKTEPEARLLPVMIAPAGQPPLELAEPDQIEIALGRTRVRVTGSVDPALLETILVHLQR